MHSSYFLKFFTFIFIILVLMKYFFDCNNETLVAANTSIIKKIHLKEKTYLSTTEHRGRLGNMLFRCASIYGIAKQLGRYPYISSLTVPQVTIDEIGKMFPLFPDYFEIKTIPPPQETAVNFGDGCCKYEPPSNLEKYRETKYLKLSGLYLQSFKYFSNYQREIKDLMECSDTLKIHAKMEAEKMWKKDYDSHKLCVHIRRKDFVNSSNLHETTSRFLIPAVSYIYDKLQSSTVSLLFVGDDKNFIKNLKFDRQFTSINVIEQNISSPEFDMCFAIEHCDTFLLSASSSSFGWWIGYSMKSQGNVYYNGEITKTPNHNITTYATDHFPPQWKRIKLLENNMIVEQLFTDTGEKPPRILTTN